MRIHVSILAKRTLYYCDEKENQLLVSALNRNGCKYVCMYSYFGFQCQDPGSEYLGT